jgi:hypothetical protein
MALRTQSTSGVDIRIYQVRFPRDVWEAIEQEQKAIGESLNAIIVRWCREKAGLETNAPKARRRRP